MRCRTSNDLSPRSAVTELGDRGDGMTGDYVRNFLDCLKSRQRPNADILVRHRSALASHLGNIGREAPHRTGLVREEVRPGQVSVLRSFVGTSGFCATFIPEARGCGLARR